VRNNGIAGAVYGCVDLVIVTKACSGVGPDNESHIAMAVTGAACGQAFQA